MLTHVFLPAGPRCPQWWGELWRRDGALLRCCPLWLGWPDWQRGPAPLRAHGQEPPGASPGPRSQPRGQLHITGHVRLRWRWDCVCVRNHDKCLSQQMGENVNVNFFSLAIYEIWVCLSDLSHFKGTERRVCCQKYPRMLTLSSCGCVCR